MKFFEPKLFLSTLSAFSLMIFCASISYADNAEVTTPEISTSLQNDADLEDSVPSWRLFGGVGAGGGSVAGRDYNDNLSGRQLLLSGLVSYQIPNWVFDSGVSWLYSKTGGKSNQDLPIDIVTRTGLFELSPRYRFARHWQIGPVYNLAFGTDTTFGPTIEKSSASSFLGLKAAYEIPNGRFPMRLWAQLSTDISIPNRQVMLGFMGVQFGIKGNSSRYQAQVEKSVKLIEAESDAVKETLSAPVKITLDPQKVFFSTNSTKIRPQVKNVLADVGKYLKENKEDWESLNIDGHADKRGKFKYNLNLSERRAESVRKAMMHEAMALEKVKVHAYSYSKPVDPDNNAAAWSKNRRVELLFEGVEKPEILTSKLKSLTEAGPWDSHENKER